MRFKIGDVVEIVSDNFKETIQEENKDIVCNVGVVEQINNPSYYKIRLKDGEYYWAWESELKLDRKAALEKRLREG